MAGGAEGDVVAATVFAIVIGELEAAGRITTERTGLAADLSPPVALRRVRGAGREVVFAEFDLDQQGVQAATAEAYADEAVHLCGVRAGLGRFGE